MTHPLIIKPKILSPQKKKKSKPLAIPTRMNLQRPSPNKKKKKNKPLTIPPRMNLQRLSPNKKKKKPNP